MTKQSAMFEPPVAPDRPTPEMSGRSLTSPGLRRYMEARGKPWELVARSWAVYLAYQVGTVDADNLRDLVGLGVLKAPEHPNQWGSVWKNEGRYKVFEDTGRHHKSQTPERKGSVVRVWRLTDYGRQLAEQQERAIAKVEGA